MTFLTPKDEKKDNQSGIRKGQSPDFRFTRPISSLKIKPQRRPISCFRMADAMVANILASADVVGASAVPTVAVAGSDGEGGDGGGSNVFYAVPLSSPFSHTYIYKNVMQCVSPS